MNLEAYAWRTVLLAPVAKLDKFVFERCRIIKCENPGFHFNSPSWNAKASFNDINISYIIGIWLGWSPNFGFKMAKKWVKKLNLCIFAINPWSGAYNFETIFDG